MDDIIIMNNVTYKYETNTVFQNFSLNLKKGSFTTLIGPIGSGKSTLVKILFGLLKAEGTIQIDHLELSPENIDKIRNKIGIVLENPSDTFLADTVMDEISMKINNKSEIDVIITKLGIEHLLNRNPHSLSSGEQVLVSLASILATEKDFIILDDALSKLDGLQKKKVVVLLQELNKKNITILNISTNIEDSLYGQEIIVLQYGSMIFHGPKEVLFKKEQMIRKAGLELPFLADLSIRLIYYGILDHIILDMDEMVNEVWK